MLMDKEFKVKDIFELVGGKQPAKKDRFENPADNLVPAITGVTVNNGTGFYTTKEGKKTYSNILTISKDGEYAGTVYLQDREVYLAGHSMGLISKIEIDNNCLIYIASLFINYLKVGYWKINAQIPSVTNTKMNDVVISLPVVENSNPDHEYTVDDIDWQYMHDYITELERDRITELDAYLQATGLNDYELTEDDKKILSLSAKRASDENGTLEDNSEDEVKFGEFVMHDIFEPLTVKKAVKANVRNYQDNEFCVPVVYAKFGDNGIMYWGRKNEFTTYSNVLSIVYNGAIAAGKCYAQEDETGILAESYLIRYKNGEVPFLANLYMSKVIEHKIYPLYSRENLAIWNNRVENEIIELPIKSDGTLDFDYMERYIRAIEKVVIADVVKYKDKVIEETRKVVGA